MSQIDFAQKVKVRRRPDSGRCENSPALQRWDQNEKGLQVRETDDRDLRIYDLC